MDTPPPQSPSPETTPPATFYHNLNLDDLRALKILGQGALGTVFLVHDPKSDPNALSPFALKVAEKSSFSGARRDGERRARWEISVLRRLSHPFLPRLLGAIDTDPDLLAWGLPFCPGGDLNRLRHRQSDRVFSPAAIRFYLAEIVLALQHLHSLGLAYRDLKPENVLVQSSGHLTLTDFDLSRHLPATPAINPDLDHDNDHNLHLRQPRRRPILGRFVNLFSSPEKHGNRKHEGRVCNGISAKHGNRLNIVLESDNPNRLLTSSKSARVSPASLGRRRDSFVGTEEYVAPEVVRGGGHGFGVDWWALGVLAYEMLYGATPFKGKTRKDTFRNILTSPPRLVGKQTAVMDLIERLLTKDPASRLGGRGGASEVMEHCFFDGVRWDMLEGVSRPPYIPGAEEEEEGFEAAARAGGNIGVREHFRRKRAPPPSPEWRKSASLSEF